MTSIDTERFRRMLREERERVVAAIEYLHGNPPVSIEDETQEIMSDSIGDAASITFERELDSTLEENSEHVLAAIDAALARIDGGTYGTCESCGGSIDPERLEAIPYATLCIECKRKTDRR